MDASFATKSFAVATGGTEHFISIKAPPHLCFQKQVDFIEGRYKEVREALRLTPETAMFRRIFVSDVINQAAPVQKSGLVDEPDGAPVAVSIVQQPPLPGSKIALFAYHTQSRAPTKKRRLSPNHILVEQGGLAHLWSTRLCAGVCDSDPSVALQTQEIFDDLIGVLSRHGGILRDHCIRTWIYLKDVDVFYQGMVDSRSGLFVREGLTQDSHYIASTGIEGACLHRYDLVAMDAYSILGLAPGQMSYLNDFDRLCAAEDYKVTFERGTRIAYADRSHYFISGTASIDHTGRVVHPGNVLRQLERALENVDGLLRSGSATLHDMMHLTVYLRDPTDFPRIDAYLAERFPYLPIVIVHAAVCRPEWLVEVEGIAAAPTGDPALPTY